mmetsp:Transcript_92970/g.277505  ORF Transcript_92970/g.277505 Transcript_92970/m.277505 type:complete len:306 (+) Transcript_92970:133-1050(+)
MSVRESTPWGLRSSAHTMTRCTRVLASLSRMCSMPASGRTMTVAARALWSSFRLADTMSTMVSSPTLSKALALSGACARPTTRSVADATDTTQPVSSSTMATLDTPLSWITWKALSADWPSVTQMGLVVQRSPAVSFTSISLILLCRNCSSKDCVITLRAFPSAPITIALRAGPEIACATSSSGVSSPTSAGLTPSVARPMTLSNGSSASPFLSAAVLTVYATMSRQSSTPRRAEVSESSTGTESRRFSDSRSMASKRQLLGWLRVMSGVGSAKSLTLYFDSQAIAKCPPGLRRGGCARASYPQP